MGHSNVITHMRQQPDKKIGSNAPDEHIHKVEGPQMRPSREHDEDGVTVRILNERI